ncbi:MAG: flagellar filament capping protein FliD [Planctomycetaceae bacterium]|nr:flagellar filament capping protein FliD [Planctomycetaceae bacterium]
MYGGPIQFGGLASGLDTQAIIQALVQAESTPIAQLNSQKGQAQQKISLLGTFEGHIKALQTLAKDLSSLGGFQSTKITASSEGVVAASAKGTPLPGSYSLKVNSLAAADRWVFDGVTSPTDDLGGGSVDFTYDGQAYSVTVDSADSSLNDIAAAINEQAGSAVTATVVNSGTSSSPNWQLIVASKQTGADYAITGLDASSISGLGATTQLSTAANATFELDGLAIERSSNTFSDVVAGLEINLQSVSPDAVQINVGVDTEGIVEKLKGFVEAYNKVVDFANGQSKYSEDGGPSGALFGDPVLRTVTQQLSGALFGSAMTDNTSSFGQLGLLGIELNTDGTLKLNETKLNAKMSEDIDAFTDFFADLDGFSNGGAAKGTTAYYTDTTADSGLFQFLSTTIDRLLDSQTVGDGATYKGLLAGRKEALDTQIKSIDKRVEQLEARLEAFEADLVKRFTALETLMSGLNSQSAYLSQQLSSTSG